MAVGTLLVAQQAAPGEAQNILDFLNQTITWYRQITAQQQASTEPSDSVEYNQDRQLADQIARLSFDFARARVQALPEAQAAAVADQNAAAGPDVSRYQGLTAAAVKTDAQIKAQQKLIAGLQLQLSRASGRAHAELEARVADESSELELMKARGETLHSMVNFVAGAREQGKRSGSLQAQIEEMAREVPAATLQSTAALSPSTTPAPVTKPPSSGLLGSGRNVLALRKKKAVLENGLELTDELSSVSQQLRQPLVNELRSLIHQGDALTRQPDSTDPKVLAQQKQAIDALTAQYKQLSASVLPLGKQALLLNLYRQNLAGWYNAANNEYSSALKGFIYRLITLAVVLGVILTFAELWRKAIVRYIHDKRRRYQFLLIRRIVVWTLMAFVVAIAFASEIGSLATFAGLLTAGLAVALQNVILSLVGYFFLIGKYGFHVGDRVQVAGVTGFVIDIGLTRVRLMETSTSGSNNRPTGRVVTFPNAVVFQSNVGIFKQAPGTKFVWHEVKVSLAAGCDYQAAEKRLLEALNSVFEDYKESINQQHGRMASELAPLMLDAPAPESRLYITDNGLAVMLRYPVDLDGAPEIDARVTKAILDAAAREPRLRIAGMKPTEQPV